MMPYRNMRHQRFSKRLKGRLELHDPHIDSQQSVAHNAVNLWIPISNINKKNSLLVYTDTFGKEIKTQSVNGSPYTNKITKDAFLGKPLAIECDIEDIVIFNSDLAHSSIINTSNITRWVITNRITIGEPEHSRQFFPLKYNDAKLYSKPKKFNNSYIIDRIKLKNLLIIIEFYLNQILTKYLKINIENKIINFVKNIFNYLGLKIRKKKIKFFKSDSFNNIKVNEKRLSVILNDKVYQFDRYCPHKGADLSGAFMENGKIYCPWHYYCFDLKENDKKNNLFKLNISCNSIK